MASHQLQLVPEIPDATYDSCESASQVSLIPEKSAGNTGDFEPISKNRSVTEENSMQPAVQARNTKRGRRVSPPVKLDL